MIFNEELAGGRARVIFLTRDNMSLSTGGCHCQVPLSMLHAARCQTMQDEMVLNVAAAADDDDIHAASGSVNLSSHYRSSAISE